MMLSEQVFAQAVLLAGDLDTREADLLHALCVAAAASLASRLKKGITPEDCKADFIAAASLYALSALETAAGGGAEEFRAGDLTVKRSGGSAASNCLRNQAELVITPYLEDRFAFLGYSMKRMVDKILNQFGTDMELHSGGTTGTVRGFLQAVNSSGWQSLESEATLLGEISRGQYTFIGPADSGIREGDTLTLGKKSYLLRRVEPYWYRNQAIYLWGLCVEKGVNDTWGSQS